MGLDVFDLRAKISLDSKGYKDSLAEAQGLFSSFGDTVKSGVTMIGKLSATLAASAATGVVALTKSAVSAYGESEQLVGGVETLFKDSASTLKTYAEQAYQTAGMSANRYMDTAIGFSGALLKSLEGDTTKAADLTNTAISDMADQANKYGRTVEEVSVTYTSLARGNTQTLDNLFGGMFAGTKAGLEEMLEYAEDYRASIGEVVDYSSDSYADIVSAIHDVSMATGVYGTTAKEAASTIQGSLGMTKAAWTNLVAGLANPEADLNKLVKSFTGSAKTAVSNLLPIIKTGLQGVGSMVTDLLPDIIEMIPDLLDDVMPSLMETIDVTITRTFPALVDVVAKNLPMLIKTIAKSGKTIVKSVFDAIDGELSGNKIYDSLKNGVTNLSKTFSRIGESLFEDGKQIFQSISDLANRIDLDKLFDSLGKAFDNAAPLIERAGDGLVWLFDNAILPFTEWAANGVLPAAIDILSEAFRLLGETIDFLKPIATAVWEEFLKPVGEWTGAIAVESLKFLKDALKETADEFEGIDWEGYWADYDNFADNWELGAGDIENALIGLDKQFKDFFESNSYGDNWNEMWQTVGGAVFDAKEKVKSFFDALEKNGEDAFDQLDQDITSAKESWGVWQDSFNEVIDKYKEGFAEVGNTLAPIGQWFVNQKTNLENFGGWIFDAKEKVIQFATDWKTHFEEKGAKVNDVVTNFKENWETGALAIWNGIDSMTTKWNDFKAKITSGAKTIKDKITAIPEYFDTIRQKLEDLANKAFTWGSDLVHNFIDGVKSMGEEWVNFWEDFGGSIADYIGFSEPEKGELSHFHEFAPDMIDLFTKGIEDNADKPLNAVNNMLGGLRDIFEDPFTADVTTGYRPFGEQQANGQAANNTVTLQLVDGAYNVIARGVANPLDILQGRRLQTAMRGRQS